MNENRNKYRLRLKEEEKKKLIYSNFKKTNETKVKQIERKKGAFEIQEIEKRSLNMLLQSLYKTRNIGKLKPLEKKEEFLKVKKIPHKEIEYNTINFFDISLPSNKFKIDPSSTKRISNKHFSTNTVQVNDEVNNTFFNKDYHYIIPKIKNNNFHTFDLSSQVINPKFNRKIPVESKNYEYSSEIYPKITSKYYHFYTRLLDDPKPKMTKNVKFKKSRNIRK